MMLQVKKTIVNMFLLAALLFPGVGGNVSGQNAFELYGTRDSSGVKLYWDCRAWPSDMAGFVIRRSEAGSGFWEDLHPSPIIPSVDQNRNYAIQGLSENYIAVTILPAIQQYLESGKINLLSAEEMRKILKSANGLGTGDRIRMKEDFILAIILGFATMDPEANAETSYEYALHPVYTNGAVGTEPLDVFLLERPAPFNPVIEFLPGKGDITLTWKMSVKEFKGMALNGFQIWRKSGDAVLKPATRNPLGPITTKDGIAEFRFIDYDADPMQDHVYTLIPVDVFQEQSEGYQVAYLADRYRILSQPKIVAVTLEDEADMHVFWSINPADSLLIKGFVLSSGTRPDNAGSQVLTDTLSADFRHYIDRTPKVYGEMYFYHLTVIGQYGQFAVSQPESFYYLGLVKPSPVASLVAKKEKRGPEVFVRLSWPGRSLTDSITKGFQIYSDELIPDSFLHISSFPLIEGSEVLFPITTQGGRAYRFRVAGVSAQGKTGDPAEATIMIGTLRLPMVTQTKASLLPDGDILVQWDYPNIPDLKGFRILINDHEVAGPETIRGDMRSFLVVNPTIPANRELAFSLVAINTETESEKGLRHVMLYPKDAQSEFGSPGNIIWEIVGKDSTEQIQLCWTHADIAGEELAGYVLYSDYHTAGRLQRMNNLPLIKGTEYIYTNRVSNRTEIQLGIAALTKTGKIGKISRVAIPLKQTEIINNNRR